MRVLASQGSGMVVLTARAANGLASGMSQGLEQCSLQLGTLSLRTLWDQLPLVSGRAHGSPSPEQSLSE